MTASLTDDTAAPAASRWAFLRWLIPAAFLLLTGWLVWRELTSFDLTQVQRTLVAVPTVKALGIAVFALIAVGLTGLVDLRIARWLKLDVRAGELLHLALIANALSNTVNLSGAMGAGASARNTSAGTGLRRPARPGRASAWRCRESAADCR